MREVTSYSLEEGFSSMVPTSRKWYHNRFAYVFITSGILALANIVVSTLLIPLVVNLINVRFHLLANDVFESLFVLISVTIICLNSFLEYLIYNCKEGCLLNPIQNTKLYWESIRAGLMGLSWGIGFVLGAVLIIYIAALFLLYLVVLIVILLLPFIMLFSYRR